MDRSQHLSADTRAMFATAAAAANVKFGDLDRTLLCSLSSPLLFPLLRSAPIERRLVCGIGQESVLCCVTVKGMGSRTVSATTAAAAASVQCSAPQFPLRAHTPNGSKALNCFLLRMCRFPITATAPAVSAVVSFFLVVVVVVVMILRCNHGHQ